MTVDDRWRPAQLGAKPPSGQRAEVWTALSVLWLWFLLPVAIHYQRQARREAEESNGLYSWDRTVWRRPVLLWLIVLGLSIGLALLMVMTGMYGDPGP